jgi:hypothetical protein
VKHPGRALLACALWLAGCAKTETVELFLKPTWSMDQQAILIIVDAQMKNVEPKPRVLSADAPLRFPLQSSGPVRFFLRVFESAANGGPAIDKYGIQFGGSCGSLELFSNEALMSPQPIDPRVSQEITLMPEPSPHRLFDLEYVSCPASACEAVAPVGYPIHGDAPFLGVAVVQEDIVFMVDGTNNLTRVEGGTRVSTITFPSGPTAIASDHLSTQFGTLDDGKVFQISPEGTLIDTFSPGFSAAGISVGRDGTAIVVGQGKAAKLTAGGNKGQLLPSVPESAVAVVVVSSTRAAVLTVDGGIYVLKGSTWGQREVVLSSTGGVQLIGDESLLAALIPSVPGTRAEVWLRNELDFSWQKIGTPFENNALYGLAAFGRGRMVAVGDTGAAGLWDGSHWCTFESGSGVAINGIDVSRSRTAAWAGTDVTTDEPRHAIRFDLSRVP